MQQFKALEQTHLDAIVTIGTFLTGITFNISEWAMNLGPCQNVLCSVFGALLTISSFLWFATVCMATHQRLRSNDAHPIVNHVTNVFLRSSVIITLLTMNIYPWFLQSRNSPDAYIGLVAGYITAVITSLLTSSMFVFYFYDTLNSARTELQEVLV